MKKFIAMLLQYLIAKDKLSISIEYIGGCHLHDWNTVYVIKPYEIEKLFDNINIFDNEFYIEFERLLIILNKKMIKNI